MPEINIPLDLLHKVKADLDSDFAKSLEGIAERFFQNYTGKDIQGYYSLPSKPMFDVVPVIDDPYVSLAAGLNLYPYEYRIVENNISARLALYEGALNVKSAGSFDTSDKYDIEIHPDYFWLSFPDQYQNILPTRIMDRHIGVFNALDNAVKGVTTEKPTRYIPTNKDTIVNFESESAVKHKVIERLKAAGYKIDLSLVFIGDPDTPRLSDVKEYWMPQIRLNPLNGRISDHNEMRGFSLHSSIAGRSLQNLRDALAALEKEVAAAILDYNPTTLPDITNKEKAQKILAQ